MIIYTDGSAHPNPGPGGYGVIVLSNDFELIGVYSKQYSNAVSNNEMELKAILYAFLNYGVDKDSFQYPIIYSDSAYAINTYSTWMFNWAQKGWIKSDKKTPENLEIIQAYYNWYQRGKRIELRKIAGHQGNYWNEIADKLATGKMTTEEVKQMIGENINY